ncbi:hypothetical protein [Bryobacter aggregatus]|uniref:hypothetical protein n=1 Tax=Bryobacter aggregatus TaxID=360054 RepID=UPI0004E2531D|nr:hypothetical protein [Bryobacter aggregatus]
MPPKQQISFLLDQIASLDGGWQQDPSRSIFAREPLLRKLAHVCSLAPQDSLEFLPALEGLARTTQAIFEQVEAERAASTARYREEVARLRQLQLFEERGGDPQGLLDRLG